mmetsp:Transcript_25495/g.33311  ORF Transcript_25495/g.33311 Transcript_25495/m.33311 type:complete len:328 (+) Transcript_25495:184-1167(+)
MEDLELGEEKRGHAPSQDSELELIVTATVEDEGEFGESSRLVESNSIDIAEKNSKVQDQRLENFLEQSLEQSKRRGCRKYSNKGDVSNFITFCIMWAGIFVYHFFPDFVLGKYILSIGLFGFAGGITNWLAIKMLFEKIPFLYGSGVIPRQFKEIRETIKEAIMGTFFDKAYLEHYLSTRSAELLEKADIGSQIKHAINTESFDRSLLQELESVSQTPDGELLRRIAPLFGGIHNLLPHIKPVILAMTDDLVCTLTKDFDLTTMVSFETVQTEVDLLMTEKLELLTPDIVKALLEQVIRDHLGWLVVWGNIFGAVIGVISQEFGYGE